MSRKKWKSEKIFERLLNNKSKKTYWDNIRELRARPQQEVFEKALRLTQSITEKEKIIGIDVLAQLGFNPRPFKKESIQRYFELLDNSNKPQTLESLFYAIGHNNECLTSAQISKIIRFKNHKNTGVRQGVVTALLGLENNKAIKTLIELTEDNSVSVRNWATFGIGSQIETSNKAIIDALWKKTKDKSQETKLEAIVGLANRNQKKVKEIIIAELENGEYGKLIFDAIVQLKDKDFLPYLAQHLVIARRDKSIPESWIKDVEECIEILSS